MIKNIDVMHTPQASRLYLNIEDIKNDLSLSLKNALNFLVCHHPIITPQDLAYKILPIIITFFFLFYYKLFLLKIHIILFNFS